MLIDWFTVIAQVINFLILVYLLKRFLYKPILNAIDEREKRIATQLQDAAAQMVQAEAQHQKFQSLKEELNKNKEHLLSEAKKEAETEQQRLMQDARKEYDELRARLHESLMKEQSGLRLDVKQGAQQEIFDIARKVLADLAGTSLEAQIVKRFVLNLQKMSKDKVEELTTPLFSSGKPLIVRSAFDLDSKRQAELGQAIKSLLARETSLEFQTNPDEIAGIELSGNGFKIAWTIREYLDTLEKRVIGLTEDMDGEQAGPEKISHEN